MDIRYNKPQFNVSLFNKQVHVIVNQKFVDNLKNYINNLDENYKDDWLDLADAFAEVQATKSYRSDNENPEFVISEFNGVYILSMDANMAEQLSKLLLTTALNVCKGKEELDFNVFIAFARRLETAAKGDYETLHQNKKFPPIQMMAPYNFMYPQHLVRRMR